MATQILSAECVLSLPTVVLEVLGHDGNIDVLPGERKTTHL